MAKNFTMKVDVSGSWQELHPKTNVDQVEGLDQIEAAIDNLTPRVTAVEGAASAAQTTADNAMTRAAQAEATAIAAAAQDATAKADAAAAASIPLVQKGANGGVATLDDTGKVPASQLPTQEKDVLEFPTLADFPTVGEVGKIYIAIDTNQSYRWSGAEYTEISSSLSLGETAGTAYRGDRGKIAYDHSQLTTGNPHGTTAIDVGADPVGSAAAVQTAAALDATTKADAAEAAAKAASDPAGSAAIVQVALQDHEAMAVLSSEGAHGLRYNVTSEALEVYNKQTGEWEEISGGGGGGIAAIPAQSGTLTYTGSTLTPSWSDYDITKMTLGGTTTGTNAGDYTATFTPLADYQWPDGTTTAKNVTWAIGRATGSSSIDPASLTLNNSSPSGTINVTRLGDGVVTASSSDTAVATVSVSDTIVTVNNVSQTSGSATITINVAQGTNYTAPIAKTCAVTASFVDTTLNGSTWAEIKQISDAGQGANYWSVGDAKLININGTIGTTVVSNYAVWVNILGFNHNSSREGANRIHFQVGRTAQNYSGNNAICFVDSTHNSYNANAGSFTMNPAADHSTSTNAGGWKNSHMRTVVLGSDSTPTSPTENSFLAALPSDLRAVMKSCTKYSDNTGGGSDTASYVTATTDYLFLLSEFEVQGARKQANSAEQNYQAQYPYYASGNSKRRYRHSATGSLARWWLRSVFSSNTQLFCNVNTDGGANADASGSSFGVAPGFCV